MMFYLTIVTCIILSLIKTFVRKNNLKRKISTLKDLAARVAFINLYQNLSNAGVKLSSENITDKVLITSKTCFHVKPEANINKMLATCFSNPTLKVGFCRKWRDRDPGTLLIVLSYKEALRWRKFEDVTWVSRTTKAIICLG